MGECNAWHKSNKNHAQKVVVRRNGVCGGVRINGDKNLKTIGNENIIRIRSELNHHPNLSLVILSQIS